MSVRDAWRASFPAQAAQDVVRHVCTTWGKHAGTPTPYFHWALHEPSITTQFKQYLENAADDAGLTGLWTAENVSMEFAPSGKPIRRNRTDIVYFSDYARLRLTFEFKKLKDNSDSRKAYYGENGMRRFLDGRYSAKQPFGIMVAIVADVDGRQSVDKLKRRMRDPEVAALVNYIPDERTGQWVREPSQEMPELAEFDTQHLREMAGFKTFMFVHLVLSFSSTKYAPSPP